ncbi:hypothetical protein P8Q88_13540 [Qipengyuania sp. XHP0207]|uniref:tetratricopeptide repeat protein n=1 Tax=Qipengyuania sp. XHP0207 TaxID=3038078 RepID=UPI00241F634A|nr:tetratricopeptide repeat protein [Qipengyuania sp. XHP0207]MDG5749199.1 hypothetical protein [Qipengyuania sp. XHP0207]
MTFGRTLRATTTGAAIFALLATGAPALAQDDNAEDRIRRLEMEVRALQRKVFPGGDGRYFEPEISARPSVDSTVSTPSTTAVTDILARLDALESQLQQQTSQIEENANAVRLLTMRLEALEGGGSAGAAGTTGNTTTGTSTDTGDSIVSPSTNAVARNTEQMTGTAATASGPSAARLAAVQAIAKPQTDDAADDEYSYGFRLWDAGFFPEAQQQLTMFVEQHPNHWRATYGRNLLGRAYLDDGKAREAAPWFLKNYQDDKGGARAGDSLLYLAESMIALNDTNRACIALAEFAETYPALASGRLSGQYATQRSKVTCN